LGIDPGVAVCLVCSWMDRGPTRFARAAAHRAATHHPTVASLLEEPAKQDRGEQ
jgi:hypothetical protein